MATPTFNIPPFPPHPHFRSYLNSNQIATLEQGSLDNLAQITDVYLQSNSIAFFPAINNCPNLRVLDLSSNQITVFINRDPIIVRVGICFNY